MAKVTFSKLGLKMPNEVKTIIVNEELSYEVKQYLPLKDKIDLVQYVIDNSLDVTTGAFSPIRLDTYFHMAVMKWYTNITFTEKQMEDIEKTFDLLDVNGIFDDVVSAIPEDEYGLIDYWVTQTSADISKFNLSVAGMLANLRNGTSDQGDELLTMLSKIQNHEGFEGLAEIAEFLPFDITGQNNVQEQPTGDNVIKLN